MHFLSVVILVVGLFVYAIVGGVIFHFIEISNENEVKANLNSTMFGMIGPCLSYDEVVTLQNLSDELFSAGVLIKKDGSTVHYSFWDYRSSIFASVDALTLVGNPAFSARTVSGFVFSIFYILIGQFLFYLSYLLFGRLLFGILSKVWSYCRSPIWKHRLGLERLAKYVMLAILGLGFFLIIPAGIFSSIEGWSFGRAFYFVMGTLLSIGFYDIPTMNPNLGFGEDTMQWYRLACGFWLLLTYFWFGGILLAYIVFMVNLMSHEADEVSDVIVKDIKHLKKRPQIPVPAVVNSKQYGPMEAGPGGGVSGVVTTIGVS